MRVSFKSYINRRIIRPVIHMAFVRAVLGFAAALLWNEFVADRVEPVMRSYVYIVFSVFFLALAWMSYLRMDGLKLPALDKRLFEWKKRPVCSYGDMSDHVNDDIPSWDDLEDDERDFCRLAANVACGITFAALSFILAG